MEPPHTIDELIRVLERLDQRGADLVRCEVTGDDVVRVTAEVRMFEDAVPEH
jgi:hypothetical protein